MHLKNRFFLLLCCFISQLSLAQTRHALIVAIGNYPNPGQNLWPVINSVNDVPLIKNALVVLRQAKTMPEWRQKQTAGFG